MAELGNTKNTIELIKKYNFSFQKKFGQNFLVDKNILEKIVDAAQIQETDYVLEIGPGIGTMTQYLAERAKAVIAVEIDSNLMPVLHDTLADYENVTVLNEDILKVDINRLIRERCGQNPVKVVANLPYYITTPIIMALFENHVALKSITIMIQKEVADRIQAEPGTKDYGALSLAVQYYAKPEIVARVPASCFLPKPNVDSTVIRLERYETPQVEAEDEDFLFAVIRASFNQRRKTLVNGLSNAPDLHITKEKAGQVLEQMGLPLTIRGETLTLEQFTKLSNSLLRERA